MRQLPLDEIRSNAKYILQTKIVRKSADTKLRSVEERALLVAINVRKVVESVDFGKFKRKGASN